MSGGHEMARNLREQEPGRGGRHAKAAGTPTITHGTSRAKRGREADMRAAPVAKLGGGDD